MMQEVERLDSLTGARFFAAAAILVFHLMSVTQAPKILLTISSFDRGGVCFFFVLSGFVLSYNYHDRFIRITRAGYWQFLRARLIRIGPTHVLTLLMITPLCLWLNSRGALLAIAPPVVGPGVAAASWLANLLLVQIYIPTIPFEGMFNAPAWSIACELIFYLSFPLFIARLARWGKSPLRLVVMASAIWLIETVAAAGFLFLRHRYSSQISERDFDFFVARMPFIRMGEFFVGCCAGLCLLRLRNQKKFSATGNQLLTIGLVAILAIPILFARFPFFKYTSWFIALTPAFAIVIVALALSPTIFTRMLEHPLILLLGEASYALYLLHWSVILLLRWRFGSAAPVWSLVTAAVICIAASVGFLIYLDQPFRRWLRRLSREHGGTSFTS